jgi:hypothetical protein
MMARATIAPATGSDATAKTAQQGRLEPLQQEVVPIPALAPDERRGRAGVQAADDRHEGPATTRARLLHQAFDGDHADPHHDGEERAHEQEGDFVVPCAFALPQQAESGIQ